MWYSRDPWTSTKFNYVVHVTPRNNGSFRVRVNFETRKNYLQQVLGFSEDDIEELRDMLDGTLNCPIQDNRTFLRPRDVVVDDATSLDDALVDATAHALKKMIETVTESVEQFIESRGQDADN